MLRPDLARPAGPHLNIRNRSPLEARIFSVQAIPHQFMAAPSLTAFEVTSSRPGVKFLLVVECRIARDARKASGYGRHPLRRESGLVANRGRFATAEETVTL